jgi:hypothetical protein
VNALSKKIFASSSHSREYRVDELTRRIGGYRATVRQLVELGLKVKGHD